MEALEPPAKVCTKCGVEKPLDAFSRNARNIDGWQYNCKECVRKYNAARYQRRKESAEYVHVEFKVCSRCRVEKPIDDFNLHRGTEDGRQRHCRECSREYTVARYHRRKKSAEYVHVEFKRCSACGVTKHRSAFGVDFGASTGLNSYCCECDRITKRRSNLKRNYGITKEQYDAMMAAQDNRCGICHKKFDPNRSHLVPCVDHCHKHNRVRMILCNSCNIGMGRFDDNPAYLRAAGDYIDFFEALFSSEEAYPLELAPLAADEDDYEDALE